MEGTTFGWVIQLQGGDDHVTDHCMFVREVNDYERSYSLDVLGVKDRGKNDHLMSLRSSRMTSTRQEDGRYQVSVPWIPGSALTSTKRASKPKET